MVNFEKKYFKYKYKYHNLLGGMQETTPGKYELIFDIPSSLQIEIEALLTNIKTHNDITDEKKRFDFYIDELCKILILKQSDLNIVEKIQQISTTKFVFIQTDDTDVDPQTTSFRYYLEHVFNKSLSEVQRQKVIDEYTSFYETLNFANLIEGIIQIKNFYSNPPKKTHYDKLKPHIHQLLNILGEISFNSDLPELKYLYILIFPSLNYLYNLLPSDIPEYGVTKLHRNYFHNVEKSMWKFNLYQHEIKLYTHFQNRLKVTFNIDFTLLKQMRFPKPSIKVKFPDNIVHTLFQITHDKLGSLQERDNFYSLSRQNDRYTKFICFEDFTFLGKFLDKQHLNITSINGKVTKRDNIEDLNYHGSEIDTAKFQNGTNSPTTMNVTENLFFIMV